MCSIKCCIWWTFILSFSFCFRCIGKLSWFQWKDCINGGSLEWTQRNCGDIITQWYVFRIMIRLLCFFHCFCFLLLYIHTYVYVLVVQIDFISKMYISLSEYYCHYHIFVISSSYLLFFIRYGSTEKNS